MRNKDEEGIDKRKYEQYNQIHKNIYENYVL